MLKYFLLVLALTFAEWGYDYLKVRLVRGEPDLRSHPG